MPISDARRVLPAVLLSVLAGCGAGGLSGTYGDARGETRYRFDGDGGASITVLGETVAAEYALNGEKVIVTSPQGTVVLTRHGEALHGPMGVVLVRLGGDREPARPDG